MAGAARGGASVSPRRLRLARLGTFALGIVLLYAPFALVARALAWVAPGLAMASTRPDVHTACMRMLLQTPTQPWLLALAPANPLYLVPLLVLPAVALAFGPLFCGWLCPAGAATEHLSRLVPRSLKIDLSGLPTAQLRYGFFAGFLVAPFVGSTICCSFCQFTPMQGLVSAAFGDLRPVAYWSSTAVVSALVWFVFLGVLTEGGRGWCVTLCPTGAVQSLSHAVGARFGWARRIVRTHDACSGCETCADVCPVRAIASPCETGLGAAPGRAACDPAPDLAPGTARSLGIDRHLCNVCMECVAACPSGALAYMKGAEATAAIAQTGADDKPSGCARPAQEVVGG